jgi:hypothetical protein
MKDEADCTRSALREDERYVHLSQNTRRKYSCLEDIIVCGIYIKINFRHSRSDAVSRICLAQSTVGMK